MNELLEQLEVYLKGVWLKRKYILLLAWLICPIGWLYVASMPDQYRATARIHIDTQSLLKPLLQGLTIQTNPQRQIELIVKTLLSRPNMEQVARMADLDLTATTDYQFGQLVDDLASGIQINQTRTQNLYIISYDHQQQDVARRVVQSLLTLLMEKTLGETRQNTTSTNRFLEEQIQEYEQRLREDESKLTEFQRKHGRLLGEGGSYSRLDAAKQQVAQTELQLKEAMSRKAAANARLRSDSDISIQTEYDGRIQQLRQELDRLLVHYTDNHPEVRLTRQRIDELETLRQEEIRQRKELLSSDYSDQSPVVQELNMAVARSEGEVASLRVRLAANRNEVARLEQQIFQLPEIEAQLADLNRDYNITKRKYEELLSRRETALFSQAAERSVDEIQFKVIDPPRVEPDPVGPPRLIFYSGITAVGLGAGLALAFLISQLNPVILSGHQLTKLTGLPVAGYIYNFDIPHKRRYRLLSNLGFFILLGILISGYLILVTTKTQLPQLPQLPILVEQIIQQVKWRVFG